MFDADINYFLPGGKLVLQFVAKHITDEQGQLDRSVLNYFFVRKTYHTKNSVERAEKNRRRCRKKEGEKTSGKCQRLVLVKHLNATFELLTGEEVDGTVLVDNSSTSGHSIDSNNFKKESLSK